MSLTKQQSAILLIVSSALLMLLGIGIGLVVNFVQLSIGAGIGLAVVLGGTLFAWITRDQD